MRSKEREAERSRERYMEREEGRRLKEIWRETSRDRDR